MFKKFTLFTLALMPLSAWGLDFENFKLENGLDVYVIEDHRTPVVVNFVWYKAGAGDEEEGKTGLAHMLEHLMFKGTENIPPQEFSKIVARHGGKDNAFTSYDYTAYFQKVAKENLPKMMEIEAERMTGLTFTDQEFQPERDVILEERRWRIDSKPQNKFFEEFAHYSLPNHPYGRPVIGWEKDIKNYTYEMNHDWYKKWYQPSNAILILIGDITTAEAKPLVEKTYGQVPSTQKIEHEPWTVEPLFKEAKRFKKIDQDVNLPFFVRSYRTTSLFKGMAGTEPSTEDVLPLDVLSQILGGGASSYLYEALVKDMKLADSVSVDYSPVARGETTFDFMIQPKEGVKLSELEKAFDEKLEEFVESDISKEDIQRAVTKLKSLDVYGRDDPFAAAYGLGKFLVAGGEAKDFDNWLTDIEKVTKDDLLRVFKKYMVLKQSTTGLLVPDAKFL
ncbi:MAG: peptidase M16 [Magnetococcales bacterium]|nr:peptidase M16 [Magnetococcales bacterium]